MLKQITITGFGGQGVVLAGRIVGQSAALGDKRESTLVQSYGPESRGGACSAQVTIADGPIYFPYIQNPDILVCLSQSGYDKHFATLKQGGTLIIDQDLVRPHGAGDCFAAGLAFALAEGRPSAEAVTFAAERGAAALTRRGAGVAPQQ